VVDSCPSSRFVPNLLHRNADRRLHVSKRELGNEEVDWVRCAKAARIWENGARGRGSDPNQMIGNMARKLDIKEMDRIVKEVGLSKAQRRLLHDEITKQNLSLEKIREIAAEIRKLYPNI
jgi:hypothetical protein